MTRSDRMITKARQGMARAACRAAEAETAKAAHRAHRKASAARRAYLEACRAPTVSDWLEA